MNAEIYFPREGKAFGQTSEKSFDDTIKKLNEINVNIIYKTEVNLTEKSISEALKVSESGDEKIGLIMIADVLSEDSEEKAKQFFESIGILGKIQKINAEFIDPNSMESENNDLPQTHQKTKKNKKAKNTPEQRIDINQSIITVEKRPVYAYAVEYNNRLLVILPRHDVLNTSFMAVLYSVADSVANPQTKEAFWKRFIPCAGDRPLDIIRKVILILAICTFLVSSYILVQMLVVEPAVNDKMTDSIKDMLVSTTEGEKDENGKPKKEVSKLPTDGSEGVISDFSELLKANPDTVGWINIPNTIIDFVVVKPQEGVDSEYYLHRDFYGNYSKYGTVFMDYRSPLDAKNLIIHGHHMQDGRMFANLAYYVEKGENYGIHFYKKTPVFTFNTIYEKSKWKIISMFKTNTLEEQGEFFNYLRGNDFISDYDFLNFVYELRVRSLINCPVDLNENDTILTLSTCAYDFEDFRTVIVARKVRDGESPDVDVSKAVENPNPLYPQIWYNYYGGTPPTVTSFQEAYNNKEIDWYDGDKKWSVNDDEELERVLSEGKKNAENMLHAFVEKIEYAEREKEEVDKLVEDTVKQFYKAENAAEVNRLYNEAVEKIKQIKTKEQADAESSAEAEASRIRTEQEASANAMKELNAKKQSAISEMRNSIAGNAYRLTQADTVNKTIDDYTKKINASDDIDEIEKLKKEAIDALAKIKTDEEMQEEESSAAEASRKAAEEASRRAEESRLAEASRQAEASRRAEESAARDLENARNEAVEELQSYVNLDDYSDELRSQLIIIISNYTDGIMDASRNEIDNWLAKAKRAIDDSISSVSGQISEPVEDSSENSESYEEDE